MFKGAGEMQMGRSPGGHDRVGMKGVGVLACHARWPQSLTASPLLFDTAGQGVRLHPSRAGNLSPENSRIKISSSETCRISFAHA